MVEVRGESQSSAFDVRQSVVVTTQLFVFPSQSIGLFLQERACEQMRAAAGGLVTQWPVFCRFADEEEEDSPRIILLVISPLRVFTVCILLPF